MQNIAVHVLFTGAHQLVKVFAKIILWVQIQKHSIFVKKEDILLKNLDHVFHEK